MSTDVTVSEVIEVLGKVLGIEDRVATFDESTPLFGSLPELDSLAVLELVTTLEDRFGITIDDDEFSGDAFETVGSLHALVNGKAS